MLSLNFLVPNAPGAESGKWPEGKERAGGGMEEREGRKRRKREAKGEEVRVRKCLG